MRIDNPILPGFNPDPSICRVGDDFYIATSTFEWFPGVQIWHSRNLSEWSLLRRPLDRPKLLAMEGIQSSGGIWAPCLTCDEGMFYLLYTVVLTWRGEFAPDEGVFKDTHNYLTTSRDIAGEWSDPVHLNSSGFDPSLFHHNGRKYLLNMQWDYRGASSKFSGILLQEYSPAEERLVGPVSRIFTGTPIGTTEGPHLIFKDGWFYLMTAEGGTSFAHAVTIARSKAIEGPYEVHPANPLLSAVSKRPEDVQAIQAFRDNPSSRPPDGFFDRPQKAGHASMCQLSEDEWALVHLGGRPVRGSVACPLGRETFLARVIFRDGWPYVVDGSGNETHLAATSVSFTWEPRPGDRPAAPGAYRNTDCEVLDEFDGPALHPAFRFLRRDPGEDASLRARPGYLRIVGRESPISSFRQSVVGVSVTHFSYRAETTLEFEPATFQQMAGLLVRYDERNQYYLRVAGDDRGGRTLGLIRLAGGRAARPPFHEIPLPEGPILLGLEVSEAAGRFFWEADGQRCEVPVTLDMLQLSDEGASPVGFTGTFVCLACHDLTGAGLHADFARFSYCAF